MPSDLLDKPKDLLRKPKDLVEVSPVAKTLTKAETIGPLPSLLERLVAQFKRKALIAPKALTGDVPFIRKATEEFVPESGLEKFGVGAGRLGRDIGITSQIAPLQGAKFLGGAGAFGALTSDTEKPLEMIGRGLGTAALFKAVDVGTKFIPRIAVKAYKKLPLSVQARFAQIGQSIGTSIKRVGKIENLKFKRYSDIKLAQIEGEKFAQTLEKNLTLQEREVLPFLREKIGIPKKLNRPDLLAIVKDKNKREVLKSFADKMGKNYDDFHVKMSEIYGDDVGFIKNYMNRLWDIPKNKETSVFNWFTTKTLHQKQRLVKTIQEGVNKFGLTPKTLDAAQLYRIYNNNVTTAMANMSFLKNLNTIKAPDGKSMIRRADKAPLDWVGIDHPVLRRAIAIPIKGRTEKGIVLNKIPVKVHPEIAEEMKTFFGSRLEGPTVRALEGMNAFAKHSQLTLSLFHHIALAESAIANSIMNPRLMGTVVKNMKEGKRPILNDPLAKEWIKSGLQVGAPTDVQRNLVESSLMAAEENLKRGIKGKAPKIIQQLTKATGRTAAVPVKALRKTVEFNNRLLWDYYHPQLKIFGANKLYQDALKSPQFAHLPETEVKREVAQWVNDSFGGQAWDLMTKSPQWKQSMHALLLSPDWTISTLRQAMAPFQVGTRSKVTAELRATLGSNFWKSGGLVMYSGINNLNRMFSSFYLGESRDMINNDPGHKTHLFIGFNKDGSKKWLRWGKQFRELPEFFINPIKKTAGKLSPVIQMVRGQTDPFPHGALAKAKGTKREPIERLKALGKSFVPFSAQRQFQKKEFSPLSFAFPVSGSRGSAYFNSLQQFEEAIRAEDKGMIHQVYRAALENGIDADKVLKRAKGNIEYESQRTKQNADKIFEDLLKLPRDQWQQHIGTLSLEDKTKRRLRTLVRERLKAEKSLEKLNKQGIDETQINEIIE